MIEERYGIQVEFGTGNIVYKESNLLAPWRVWSHFGPSPLCGGPSSYGTGRAGEADSSLRPRCSEDDLDRNWQRLVLTHLEEKVHRGVLTGAAIDMKITLVAGRAHNKHTEGGDFRQATYRALRQGLWRPPAFFWNRGIPSAWKCRRRPLGRHDRY